MTIRHLVSILSSSGLNPFYREKLLRSVKFIMDEECNLGSIEAMVTYGQYTRPAFGEIVPMDKIEFAVGNFIDRAAADFKEDAENLAEESEDGDVAVLDVVVKMETSDDGGLYMSLWRQDEEDYVPWVLQILPVADGDESLLNAPHATKEQGD